MHNKENDTTDSSPGNEHEMSKLQKLLDTERILKQQAVNKLAEIMNRKDFVKKDKKAESKASSSELRKKEKENRKLQQELTMEKEKFNQMAAKFQKDLQDLQVHSLKIVLRDGLLKVFEYLFFASGYALRGIPGEVKIVHGA